MEVEHVERVAECVAAGVFAELNMLQLTSLLEQLRCSAAWLSEDTRLEFWKKCQSMLMEHNVTALTAANFLQVFCKVSGI